MRDVRRRIRQKGNQYGQQGISEDGLRPLSALCGSGRQAPRLHRQLLPPGDLFLPAQVHRGGEQGPRDLQGHSGGGELLRYPVGCGRAGGDHRPVRLQVRPGDGQVRRPGGGDRQQRQSIPEGAHGLPHRMQGGGPDGDRQLPPFRGPGHRGGGVGRREGADPPGLYGPGQGHAAHCHRVPHGRDQRLPLHCLRLCL